MPQPPHHEGAFFIKDIKVFNVFNKKSHCREPYFTLSFFLIVAYTSVL